ncbi:uncharacterized protein BX663DRAFT_527708 [Cokeromyces recurvatus]|uniref:uncharacterized protein n=1 Tax=Cokeromyces recurvatus TaxID=90255 RepID=UPI002220B0A8|nr:uncharacterized protein BX663DRAFT_527708 [Cokeromyces recurvatus]KAI7897622.1 hypothetical protein BX663DRAFT_527708 [Cokeromyces recurvatus]
MFNFFSRSSAASAASTAASTIFYAASTAVSYAFASFSLSPPLTTWQASSDDSDAVAGLLAVSSSSSPSGDAGLFGASVGVGFGVGVGDEEEEVSSVRGGGGVAGVGGFVAAMMAAEDAVARWSPPLPGVEEESDEDFGAGAAAWVCPPFTWEDDDNESWVSWLLPEEESAPLVDDMFSYSLPSSQASMESDLMDLDYDSMEVDDPVDLLCEHFEGMALATTGDDLMEGIIYGDF